MVTVTLRIQARVEKVAVSSANVKDAIGKLPSLTISVVIVAIAVVAVAREVSIADVAVVVAVAVTVAIAGGVSNGEGSNVFREKAYCIGLRGDGGKSDRSRGRGAGLGSLVRARDECRS